MTVSNAVHICKLFFDAAELSILCISAYTLTYKNVCVNMPINTSEIRLTVHHIDYKINV